MSASPTRLELLAPAKTADIGIAAVNHGADAVYIGGPSFGARHNAGNRIEEIERLVRHAHRFNARIFLTLNTILRDDELEAARRLIHSVYEAGVDALIIQDMGLLMLDLPPIQLHASTQCDIRTPEKARFLQDAGFSQIVAARELSLEGVRSLAQAMDQSILEFFIHGALCVAYSGQCYISHAQTGRSANRGDCSQACRLPYEVVDEKGRIVAHQKHVLSIKDNDQSENLKTLMDAGVRSFKIEGRYKDMAYVKNITSHYRLLIDQILEERPALRKASSGITSHHFVPDPKRSFNRGSTDYFVTGRKEDIGAFDTPKPQGLPLGWVERIGSDHIDLVLDPGVGNVNNGDTLTYFDLQKELKGFRVNTAKSLGDGRFRAFPNELLKELKDLRKDTILHRSRDMAWERLMESDRSAERHIPLWMMVQETSEGLRLDLTDDEGIHASASIAQIQEPSRDAERQAAQIREALGKLGGTDYTMSHLEIQPLEPNTLRFWPVSVLNTLRREGIEALNAEREKALSRLPRREETQPPPIYPDDTLSYLANVYNEKAQAFYLAHGVKVVDAAYESHEETGDVSLMITKHCIRFSLSLCPKQTKGVLGVQGTIRAEPLELVNGNERLTLRFDCRACEMHVMGKIKRHVLKDIPPAPIHFYRKSGFPSIPS
jgi:23S rRNA 5-hydroxycytidine C2501 synthase